jgi:hypothetical protein
VGGTSAVDILLRGQNRRPMGFGRQGVSCTTCSGLDVCRLLRAGLAWNDPFRPAARATMRQADLPPTNWPELDSMTFRSWRAR